MGKKGIDRRHFLKYVMGSAGLLALDWNSLPRRVAALAKEDEYDAVIVGSGLGGLSCAAAFARQGFEVLVLEQHDKPGGHATAFQRPGGFNFDVSLHSTVIEERKGLHNLIPGFPEITEVQFVPHPSLYRVIYPDYDITVPQRDPKAYTAKLVSLFPEEKDGIEGILGDMQGLLDEVQKMSRANGQIDMERFAVDYPLMSRLYNRTWKDMLDARVGKILTKDHAAYGVRTSEGEKFKSRVVVSNANPFDTFRKLTDEEQYLSTYLDQLDHYSVSLSSFQIFLGLKDDIVGKSGIKDSEIFYETGYDMEEGYLAARRGEIGTNGYALTLYDNMYKGYSPQGKNTVNITTFTGYDYWKKFEAAYFAGDKDEYRKEKERLADILIDKVEKTLLPGLSGAIEVKEIGTPLTNVRYTSNYRGAIFGLDQTVDNSGPSRLGHDTPIGNLYLAGAWTKPGHGYGSVLSSGVECFGEIVQKL